MMAQFQFWSWNRPPDLICEVTDNYKISGAKYFTFLERNGKNILQSWPKYSTLYED